MLFNSWAVSPDPPKQCKATGIKGGNSTTLPNSLYEALSFLILTHKDHRPLPSWPLLSLPNSGKLPGSIGIYPFCCTFYFFFPDCSLLFSPSIELSTNIFFLYFFGLSHSLRQKDKLASVFYSSWNLKSAATRGRWAYGTQWIRKRHPVAQAGTLHCLGSQSSHTPLATFEPTWRPNHMENFFFVILFLPSFLSLGGGVRLPSFLVPIMSIHLVSPSWILATYQGHNAS